MTDHTALDAAVFALVQARDTEMMLDDEIEHHRQHNTLWWQQRQIQARAVVQAYLRRRAELEVHTPRHPTIATLRGHCHALATEVGNQGPPRIMR